MEMKEAAKTSIFSKLWRYLCAKSTHLDFSHLIVFPDSDPDVNSLFLPPRSQKNKYINWVNQVVDLHCSPCINTFKICLGFHRSDAHHIDKWVRFAVSRKVKNLELDLIIQLAVYTLTDILKPTLGVGESGANFLQSLHLNGINVSGDILEYLLVQCCLLERLHVEGSETLVRFKVFSSSCKLKQLTIFGCRNLEQLEIDAVNLLYLRYRTLNPCTNVVFKNMPMLIEAMFGGYCLPDSTTIFRQLSHLEGQISKLTLDLVCLAIPIGLLPTFCKVKQLTLIVIGHTEFDLVVIRHFLKACPALQEFTLEITWRSDELPITLYFLVTGC
ncbi:F-box/LRR-repeat protein At3g58900-like [Silene latifolia]|uniref:F-box/LRR-repeat protein At3g58900-like n=1 Tax=Silene latifolia TaxID=37657 RepID=UPI003D7865C2